MATKISTSLNIYDIINLHPDVKDIMVELGFHDIVKPGMLQSAGRIMTIEKGAKAKNIEWSQIERTFKEHGYILQKEKLS